MRVVVTGFLPPPVAILRRPSVLRVLMLDGTKGDLPEAKTEDCWFPLEKSGVFTKSTAGWLKSNSGVCMERAGWEIVVAGLDIVVAG